MPTVDHPVSLVVQSTDWNCWAASLAMMLGRSSDADVVNELKGGTPDANWDDGATPVELGWAAGQFGLSQGVSGVSGCRRLGPVAGANTARC